ncbi:MAG: GatB/YqeY domain-containing protein [Candidatus Delongbacteria bacterium]|nr:GatB/YqeY domain-containing protein [Candidatus Delongbacteria bacterium]
MVDLEKQLTDLLKDAMRNKDSMKLDAIRSFKSAIQYYKIEKMKKELDENDYLSIVSKMIKQRKESIEEFTKAGRIELAAKEEFEYKFLSRFMPEQMNADQVEAEIRTIIQSVGASGKKDFGKVMKEASVRLKGKADGNLIRQTAEKLLS